MRLAIVFAFAFAFVFGCEAGRDRIELDKGSAVLQRSELERADRELSSRTPEDLAAWRARLDRRLPDLPRGALTASIAAMLRGIEGAEVDGSEKSATHGQVLTDPVTITVPGGIEAVADFVLNRIASLDRTWQLDMISKIDPRYQRVRLHGYLFAESSLATETRPEITVSEDEGGWLAKDRDAMRAETRRAIEETRALKKKLAERGLTDAELLRFRKAELKQSLITELDQTARKAQEDLTVALKALADAKVTPLELTFSLRMGRRVCTIRFDEEAEMTALLAVIGTRYDAVTDAKKKELVLPSGRVCSLGIGPVPKR